MLQYSTGEVGIRDAVFLSRLAIVVDDQGGIQVWSKDKMLSGVFKGESF